MRSTDNGAVRAIYKSFSTFQYRCMQTKKKNIDELGPVHTYPFSLENATFSLWIRLSVHTYPMKTVAENATF